jgi:tRNA(Ile2) C34 agmatinyltransferase TiaS
MARISEARRCPKCGRKMALQTYSDEFSFGSYCRWDDCGYRHLSVRPWE